MDDTEDSPSMEVRSAKRPRLEGLATSQLKEGSRLAEAAVPISKEPAMHTKALRSVLKGAYSPAFDACSLRRLVSCTSLISLCLCLQCLLSRRVSFGIQEDCIACPWTLT